MKGTVAAIGLLAVLSGYSLAVPTHHLAGKISRSFKDPTPEDIEFQLYTRSNENSPDRLVAGDLDSLTSSHFDASLPLKVVAHGFNEDADTSEWMPAVKDEYLKMDDANVILINWKILCAGVRYDIAHKNALYVGEQLAVLFKFIEDNASGFSGSQVHIVGFSLGAHVAGAAGGDYPNVARITGLDAAGPLYDSASIDNRLDPSDAKFVDIIHTNAGVMLTGHFGFDNPLGHVDFYMNGGSSQFGCPNFIFDTVWDLINLHPGDIDACSHGRSHEYYLESLKSGTQGIGYECADYDKFMKGECFGNTQNTVGYHVSDSKPGVYYLNTQGESDYFGQHFKLTVEIGGDDTYHGQIDSTLLLPNDKKTRTHELTSGWPSLEVGTVLSTAVIIPSSSEVTDIQLDLLFRKNELMPLSPNHITLKKVEAQDPNDNSRWCYGTDLELHTGDAQQIIPTKGAC